MPLGQFVHVIKTVGYLDTPFFMDIASSPTSATTLFMVLDPLKTVLMSALRQHRRARPDTLQDEAQALFRAAFGSV
jgi:hypothetical protein